MYAIIQHPLMSSLSVFILSPQLAYEINIAIVHIFQNLEKEINRILDLKYKYISRFPDLFSN